jgi:hypothetical protein
MPRRIHELKPLGDPEQHGPAVAGEVQDRDPDLRVVPDHLQRPPRRSIRDEPLDPHPLAAVLDDEAVGRARIRAALEDETARFLARVNSPALQAVWDPGNAFFADETAYPNGYSAIRNYVKHVHVKDAEQLASGRKRFIVVGEGEIDYKAQFAALKADGYKGHLSLETHYRPFAGTPEQGSRLCLQGMNAILTEL